MSGPMWSRHGYIWGDGEGNKELPDPLYFWVAGDVSTETWTGWYNAGDLWNNATNSLTNFEYTENMGTSRITALRENEEYFDWSGIFITPPDMDNYGYMILATVKLNEYYTDNYPYYKRVGVAAHEFGHTLGMAHYSGPVLMEPFDNLRYDTYSIYSPQADDVEGVLVSYP